MIGKTRKKRFELINDRIIEQIIDNNLRKFINSNIDLFVSNNQLNYWLYINLKGKISKSSGLSSSTIPNPANWFPNTDEIIFYYLEASEGLEEKEEEDYYLENPKDFPDDCYYGYYEEILKKAIGKFQKIIKIKK